jgi:hypothetical protein
MTEPNGHWLVRGPALSEPPNRHGGPWKPLVSAHAHPIALRSQSKNFWTVHSVRRFLDGTRWLAALRAPESRFARRAPAASRARPRTTHDQWHHPNGKREALLLRAPRLTLRVSQQRARGTRDVMYRVLTYRMRRTREMLERPRSRSSVDTGKKNMVSCRRFGAPILGGGTSFGKSTPPFGKSSAPSCLYLSVSEQ